VHILPPTNVQLTPLPSQRGVFISWELGESYYGPGVGSGIARSTGEPGEEAT